RDRDALPPLASRTPRKLPELWLSLLLESVPSFLRLLRHVEEHGGVAGELLDSRLPVERRVEAALQHPHRHGAELEHFLAPLHGFFLEACKRNHGIDQTHGQRLLRVVLAAEEPD